MAKESKQVYNIIGTTLYVLKVADNVIFGTERTLDLESIIDLPTLLASIREQEPELYMRGVTSDMLLKYT